MKLITLLILALTTITQAEPKPANMPEFTYTTYIAANTTKVWDALTNQDQVKNYYLAPLTKIELNKGGAISYGDGMISGTITEITPQKSLTHTFKFAHHKDEPETTVTYTLTPIDNTITQLTLTHTGFKPNSKTYTDITGGWPCILSALKTYLETGKPFPWPNPNLNTSNSES